jgi:Fe-Mn family superoxide dismutase
MEKTMALLLPDLPFAENGLEPHISQKTLEFHHGKHHAAYVNNGNKLIAGTEYAEMAPEAIMQATAGKADQAGVFNNVAQAWNHAFYWHCMTPNGGGKPGSKLLDLIDDTFGSFDDFMAAFKQAGATQFGSGWAWLVVDNGKLVIEKTANADSPVAHGKKPILTVDVWEHAYYLDYQNRRPDYLGVFMDSLVNWEFVESNL